MYNMEHATPKTVGSSSTPGYMTDITCSCIENRVAYPL